MNLDPQLEANAKVLAALSNLKQNEPLIASPDSGNDPYYHRGCHPEIVERIWDQIGKAFPPEARCLIYSTPALVEPETGLIIAVGYGTAYCVRIPVASVTEAIHLGASLSRKWSNGKTTNIQDEFGEGWVFGAWLTQEAAWCKIAGAEKVGEE